MGTFKWRSSNLVSFSLFCFTLFACNHSATSEDGLDICKMVFCGMGTCHLSAREQLGFRCDCNTGWKNLPLLPTCAIPNCLNKKGAELFTRAAGTFDLQQCGGPLPNLPSPNISNPCLINFCGDGECQLNGILDFKCQCHEGSANLLKNPKLPCFKKCTIGADCPDLDLGFGTPSSPTLPSSPSNSGSPGAGFGAMLNSSRELHILKMMILATIFLNWN